MLFFRDFKLIQLLFLTICAGDKVWSTWKIQNPDHPGTLVVACFRSNIVTLPGYSPAETTGNHAHENCVTLDIKKGGDIQWDITKLIPPTAHALFQTVYIEGLESLPMFEDNTFINAFDLLKPGGWFFLDYQHSIYPVDSSTAVSVDPNMPFKLRIDRKAMKAWEKIGKKTENKFFHYETFPAIQKFLEKFGFNPVSYFIPSESCPITFNERTDGLPLIFAMKPNTKEQDAALLAQLQHIKKTMAKTAEQSAALNWLIANVGKEG